MKQPTSTVLPIAQDLLKLLAPLCQRIELAGSLRRRKEWVHDIDVIVIPYAPAVFAQKVMELYGRKPEKIGPKYIELASYQGVQVDCYLADLRTWPTLLLIRTGSKEHNIKLCSKAKAMGLQLKANGDGLLAADGSALAVDTEADIFRHLGVPYREPWQRD